MTKKQSENLSTVVTEASRKENKASVHMLMSIGDDQYGSDGKLLKKSLTDGQKKEISDLAKLNIMAIDPRHGRWLPGCFRGRAKTGGRKKGVRNKYADVRDILKDIGCNPVLGLARIAMNKKNEVSLRARCYTELAQYCHPKVKSVDQQTGDSNQHNTLTVQIVGSALPGDSLPDPDTIDAEILPYEEDGVTHHGIDDDDMELQPSDIDQIEEES